MIPECALQNVAQPHRNPNAGDSVSFRNTYTPPVRGYTPDNSAHTSDPNSVSTPAAIHTLSTPAVLGTCRLISDGCTKIDAPMMIPATMQVACRRPIGRCAPFAKIGKVYHFPSDSPCLPRVKMGIADVVRALHPIAALA